MSTVETILNMAQRIRLDERKIGVLSTGERIAVALVLDRKDLLDWGTILESVRRLGPEWTEAALQAQRLLPELADRDPK